MDQMADAPLFMGLGSTASTVRLHEGDCLDVMRAMLEQGGEGQFDSVVTDPPYHLTPGKSAKAGFMGKSWDGGDVAFRVETWDLALRLLKPGGHLIAFGGTRTYHRIACAVEDAGFELRDRGLWMHDADSDVAAFMESLSPAQRDAWERIQDGQSKCGSGAWAFGSGFPKSLDVEKAIERQRIDNPDWIVVGQWLRAIRKASGISAKGLCARIGAHGATNHGGAVSNWENGFSCPTWEQWNAMRGVLGFSDEMDAEVWRLNGRKGQPGDVWWEREIVGRRTDGAGNGSVIGLGSAKVMKKEFDITAPATEAARKWSGWGTSLKPAYEPWLLARKPLEGTVAQNILAHGCGGLNIDASRIGTQDRLSIGAGRMGYHGADGSNPGSQSPLGRFPANLIHDGSETVETAFAAFGESKSSSGMRGISGRHDPGQGSAHKRMKDYTNSLRGHSDTGTASRFFYAAKASKSDRAGSVHPTVKPLSLMKYLVKLVCPPGGTVLDPFAGSGTTGQAAVECGFNAVLVERESEYCADIRRRLAGYGI